MDVGPSTSIDPAAVGSVELIGSEDDSEVSLDDWSECDSLGDGVASQMLGMFFMANRPNRSGSRCHLQDFPELPCKVEPLRGELASACDLATSDAGIKDAIKKMKKGPTENAEISTGKMKTDAICLKRCERGKKADKTCIASRWGNYLRRKVSGCKAGALDKQWEQRSARIAGKWGNTHNLLQARELGLCRGGGFSQAQRSHMVCDRILPRTPVQLVDEMNSRAYIGQFSVDGSLFVAAFQDRRIRIYDVDRNWQLKKDVIARMLRWTITDTALSPDRRFLLYSSITPVVHLVNIESRMDEVESLANVTDVHDALFFGSWEEDSRFTTSFGIWSIAWSSDSREIIAGTNDKTNVCLFDVEARKTSVAVQGHQDDVNAVAFMDDSAQVFASGSDDTLVKIWDRRVLTPRGSAAGVLVGHTEGITHISAKGDGRHLISNSKDQTIKLWDIRKMKSEDALRRQSQPNLPHFHWDYRWNDYPGAGRDIRHPNECSLMTYRGHSVLQTLIRAYFSPLESTGQRYIYTGSHSGKVHIFDLVSGEEVQVLDHHKSVVRDCSWHPYNMMLASISWDGSVVRWDPSDGRDGTCLKAASVGDKYDY